MRQCGCFPALSTATVVELHSQRRPAGSSRRHRPVQYSVVMQGGAGKVQTDIAGLVDPVALLQYKVHT